MNVEIVNHPAIARFNGQPLKDSEGHPVPLFPDQRAVKVDGTLVAYTADQPDAPLSFCRHYPPAVCEAITAAVTRKRGAAPSQVNTPPKPSPAAAEE